MLQFAIYISDHGFGHAARIAALAEEFIHLGIYCHLITRRPPFLFSQLDPHLHTIHPRAVDTGVKHFPGLSSDLSATKQAVLDLLSQRNNLAATEIDFLRSNKIDLIIADAPFLVIDFAAYTSIPTVCITNFDWHYIYSRLFAEDVSMLPVLNLIWSLYRRFNATFCLPFSTQDSVSALANRTESGLLARAKQSYIDIRHKLGWPKETRILLVMFGGEGSMEIDYEVLCASFPGKVISIESGIKATNHHQVNQEDDFLDLIYNADIVLCKPGYSTLAEAVQFGKFIIYSPRHNYPEEIALLEGLKNYPNCLKLDNLKLTISQWKRVFTKIAPSNKLPGCYINRNQEVAALIVSSYLKLAFKEAKLLSVFDLGTNNLNYLLYDLKKGKVIHKAYCTTALGRNFSGTVISAYRITKAKQAIKQLLDLDFYLPSEKVMLCTGISRMAANYKQLSNWISRKYNINCILLDAKAETKYAFHAALSHKSGEEVTLAVDIGGASTEFINLSQPHFKHGISLNIGLLTLYNSFQEDLTAASERIRNELASIPYQTNCRLIGIGLTYTYLAAIYSKQIHTDPDRFDGMSLQKNILEDILQDLLQGKGNHYLAYLADKKYLPILKLNLTFTINLLDRFATSEIIVCSDGISVGYANWRVIKARRNK